MDETILTLPEKLIAVAKQNPAHSLFYIYDETASRTYNYEELLVAIAKIAAMLKELGVSAGDKVAIAWENSFEWAAIYFAILFVGGIAVPLDPLSKEEDFLYYLSDSNSKLFFAGTGLENLLPKLKTPDLKKIITPQEIKLMLGSSNTYTSKLPAKNKNSASVSAGLNPTYDKIAPSSIAAILYTSGTTGKPKGVMLTHANFYSNFLSIAKLNFLKGDDNVAAFLPWHHSFPFMVTLLIPLFTASTITIVNSLKSAVILAAMRVSGVTALVGVPQIYSSFYKEIKAELAKKIWPTRLFLKLLVSCGATCRKITKINFNKILLKKIHAAFGTKLKYLISGGAKLDEKVGRFLSNIGFTIVEGYGLSETAPIVTFNPPNKIKIGSAGVAIPDVKIKILAPDENGIGEIAISGPNVMLGYYHKETETEAALQEDWFLSGDLGYLDNEDYLYITGRKKELIVLSSGKKVVPEELENHYLQSPFIKELCIMLQGEEKLVAVAVPNFNYFRAKNLSSFYDTLKWEIENLSKELTPYKRVLGFIISKEELPKTRLGKLQRFAIQKKFAPLFVSGVHKTPEVTSEISELTTAHSAIIKNSIAKTFNLKMVHDNDHLEIDLGIGSLAKVEMLTALEKALQAPISEKLLSTVFTVAELITALEEYLQKAPESAIGTAKVAANWQEILQQPLDSAVQKTIKIAPTFLEKIFGYAINLIVSAIVHLFWPTKVYGKENLPPEEQPLILCANHTSYLDGFLLAAALPKNLRKRLFFMGYQKIFQKPFIKKLVHLMQIIPIDSNENIIAAMQAATYVLRQNKVMVIFPEGARSVDGKLQKLKKGATILATELKINILPIHITGAFEAWPRTSKFPRPHRITITIGKLLPPNLLLEQPRVLAIVLS